MNSYVTQHSDRKRPEALASTVDPSLVHLQMSNYKPMRAECSLMVAVL
jgi:hypothetical protein